MKKYIDTAKIVFRSQLVYRFDVAMTALATIGRILFAFILWSTIFAERETVGGFTYQEMLSYYLISSFLASLEMSAGVSGEVSGRIRGGTFSKYMVIPSNPLYYFMAQNFGAVGYYAIFSGIAAMLSLAVFRITPGITSEWPVILCAMAMIPLGLIFMVVYQFFIGILAFKFQDTGFFLHIQGALLSFATGTIVPLSLLPDPVFWALRFLPFTYVSYTPTMLLTGKMGLQEGVAGLTAIMIWVAVMVLLVHITYRRLRIKYDGVGI
ncbi:ABC-2 type transport system permease protein [Anaerotaenia torta]|uniref:ABC transporter permease n=1 Tax=Anaerotaenia torta TaxID=433293 RepID=UPI003D2000AC